MTQGSKSLSLVREGSSFRVDNLERASRFYRDLLGIQVERYAAEWIDLSPKLGMTLSQSVEVALEFHVENFEEAAQPLEGEGIEVLHENMRTSMVES